MHEILHFVQNDTRGVFIIATQSLEGEEEKSSGPTEEIFNSRSKFRSS